MLADRVRITYQSIYINCNCFIFNLEPFLHIICNPALPSIGKTTFLNDVHKFHKCTYIRQYHNLRPYIKVSAIPNFDPRQLPYWDIYIREKKESSIIVGGTIGGQFMPGLSGGQRKMLLFELICQRTSIQENLLIVLDEPFAGVTDDFVPYIIERLNQMRMKHNILLVTNDHVEALKKMADNTVTVSAIDRSSVNINGRDGVNRELALLAMSIGDEYRSTTNKKDMKFFRKVELSKTGGLPKIFINAMIAFGLFIATFWDSASGSEALVVIAGGLVTFCALHPYILQIVDWRIYMLEEAEALLHSSISMNKFLKSSLFILLLFILSGIQFLCINVVLGTLTSAKYFIGFLSDNFSDASVVLCLGLFTDLSAEEVQIIGSMKMLFTIFFSTTFSPGAGVPGLNGLRYITPRFYLWCMLPGVGDYMEGCPADNLLVYLVMSALLIPYLFAVYAVAREAHTTLQSMKKQSSRRKWIKSAEYKELQHELFSENALANLKQFSSLSMGGSFESHGSYSID